MDRRKALKNMGVGAAATLYSSSVISLLQSCKKEVSLDWKPVFLTSEQGRALTLALDVIIPTTDTPGANDVNVAQFIDAYMNEVAGENQQKNFQRTANAFIDEINDKFDQSIVNVSIENVESLTKELLTANSQDLDEFETRLAEEQGSDKPTLEDHRAGAYGFLKTVRDLGVWAWKTSEEIGKNVLWYDPVPQQYIGCMPVEEADGGKAMSL